MVDRVETTSTGVVRAAAVQLSSTGDKRRNVAVAEALVGRAARAGAHLVVLPEKWNLIDVDERQVAQAEPLDGESLGAARGWARRYAVALVAGSISEAVPGADRAYNTSVLIQPDGSMTAVYRKLHLFDVEVGGHAYRESAGAIPGSDVVVADALGHRIGLSVCYDLRFPELYRRLSLDGADILAVPSAFTVVTGQAHWEPLLRARAIENQAYVIAAGQTGVHATGTSSHGHSMIVDPWGRILAAASDGEDVITADLDFSLLADIRGRVPALRHRRHDVL
jgi:deaminated glutathione amidase